jgi:hypothetical protein
VPESRTPIITLTTDYGLRDHYVGAVKGAILAVNRDVCLVDITHEAPPHRPLAAGFLLAQAYATFPPRTIHILVVDPGVGGPRRPILAIGESHYFLAPDNGALSYVFAREPQRTVFELNVPHYFHPEVSDTFHGRDIFAPVAGWLSRGTAAESFGTPIADAVASEIPRPTVTRDGQVRLTVLHVDRFGNVITNIARKTLEELIRKNPGKGVQVTAAGQTITGLQTHYAEGPAGAPFALYGSTGYLEIALKEASASEALGLAEGQQLVLTLA